MNVFLKSALKAAMDAAVAGKDAISKNWSKFFMDLVALGEDVPTVISNLSTAKPELEALLANPSADADLLAYGASLVGGESPAVAAVVSASADLLLTVGQKSFALYAAIEAAKASAPAAAPAAPQA